MKRIVPLLFAVVMTFYLSGCKSDDYKKAAELYEKGRYEQAKEAFTELGNYKDSAAKADNCSVEECIDVINEALGWNVESDMGFKKYQTAFRKYGNLKPELKSKVSNAEKLLAFEDEYEQVSLEKEIAKAVIKAADFYVEDFVDDHLDALCNTYERFDKPEPLVTVEWDASRENISGLVSFEYSYQNSYGRTIETSSTGSWKGTYKNGVITISDEMNFPDLKLALLDRFNF